jgi:hypothetical protein
MDNKQTILNRFSESWADFYGRYVDLSGQRNGSVAICSPFREEKEPSFQINLEGKHAGRWHDFGTGEGGDLFTFYARLHNLDCKRAFRKVCKGIADDFGISLNDKAKGSQRRERRPKTPKEALHSFQVALKDSELLADLKQRRGLSDETVARFELGRWQNSVVFPVRDAAGAIVGFKVHKGPHLKPDGTKARRGEGIPAQLYPPLSALSAEALVICEGEPDLWRLDTAGVRAITGTAGAGVWRDEWTAALKGKEITVALDNDQPGHEAQGRLVKALKGIAKSLCFVEWPEDLPEGYDVTDWLQSGRTFTDLPTAEVKVERVTLPDVKAAFGKWLHFDEGGDIVLDVVLGAVVANRFSGDSVWLFIVAPPGGSKTETLRSLSEWREVYMLSTLTPSTLVSGFVTQGGEDPSLLPRLNGKVLIVKDFTAILDMPREARQQILGDLRDAYDGSMSKAFGSGAGTRSYASKFGLIAAVTPAVDRYSSVTQDLGERFLKFRLSESGARARVKKALANSGQEGDMRAELSHAAEGALLTCDVQDERAIAIREGVLDKLIDVADLLAVLRSNVSRDGYTRAIDFLPEPEIGTRLVKQFAKLARGIAAIRGKTEVGEDEYRLIRRIARDTLPSKRAFVVRTVYQLYHEGFLPTSRIADEMDMPTETVRYALEDLRLLKIVDRQGEKPYLWRMSPEFSSRLEALDLFEDTEAIRVEMSEGDACSDKKEGVEEEGDLPI